MPDKEWDKYCDDFNIQVPSGSHRHPARVTEDGKVIIENREHREFAKLVEREVAERKAREREGTQ